LGLKTKQLFVRLGTEYVGNLSDPGSKAVLLGFRIFEPSKEIFKMRWPSSLDCITLKLKLKIKGKQKRGQSEGTEVQQAARRQRRLDARDEVLTSPAPEGIMITLRE
jgi:hypothetical protein